MIVFILCMFACVHVVYVCLCSCCECVGLCSCCECVLVFML